MKSLLKLEELSLLILAFYLFLQPGVAWWWFPVLFFAPDLSMIAYLAGPRAGAIVYDLVHHKGIAIALYLLGAALGNTALMVAGAVMFGHSSFDRIFGYRLKYPDSFNHTHLGMIGR